LRTFEKTPLGSPFDLCETGHRKDGSLGAGHDVIPVSLDPDLVLSKGNTDILEVNGLTYSPTVCLPPPPPSSLHHACCC